jgi:signal transduction histidine kinase
MQGRVFLVLIGGIVASALLTALLADREGRRTFAQVRAAHTADRVEQLVTALEAVPPEVRATLAATLQRGMTAQFAGPEAPRQEVDAELTAALTEEFGGNRTVVANAGTSADCVTQPGDSAAVDQNAKPCRVISLTLRDGTPLRLILRPQPELSWTRPHSSRWLLYAIFFPVCLGLLAYVVARMATRPLNQLAQAATELGGDINRPPLVERGPAEVRDAAAAFNAMQARIRRYVEERTEMLAAIAHDLQTPLTRLRLRLEKVNDTELRDKLVDDLASMQIMIREGLDLASIDAGGLMQLVDVDSLLSSVCADAVDAGHEVTLVGQTRVSIPAIPGALQRCLTNLIDNAVKYGGYARVTAGCEAGNVVIRVADGGPGIPEAQMERVFAPFYRLETSRSRETGGSGLGLTIARNIAHKHGGTLTLRNKPGGGLECLLVLPIQR